MITFFVNIILQGIPGHLEIPGNDIFDTLQKRVLQAHKTLQVTALSFLNIKLVPFAQNLSRFFVAFWYLRETI